MVNSELTLEDRINTVIELRKQGYNCAQCLTMAFNDVLDLDSSKAAILSAGLGGGIGGCGEVCGVISSMSIIQSAISWQQPADKPRTYSCIRTITSDFSDKYGAVRCAELKALKRPCIELIKSGVERMHELTVK